MCGFFGEISKKIIDKQSFIKLLDLSKHRGPDFQGYWSNNICQLGFNRLSILDLSENALQPILSISGRFVILFNGEIYNFKELKFKYKISDNVLRSNSDTEILAHIIEKLDIYTFANELNGMFAISIYDIEKNEVSLIRDFAGIKPLYYGIHKEGYIFASQFDQVFCHPAFINSKELRPEIMKEYFAMGYMHAPNTVFKNIFQVQPGEIITINFNSQNTLSKKYYDWKTHLSNRETCSKTTEIFKSIFSKAIENQLISDVPIATFLSSGIDSSLVTAFSKKFKNDINSYTFGIDDDVNDESETSKIIAKQLKVKHVIDKISKKEIVNVTEKHFNYFSEPLGDYSSIPLYLITNNAKKHFTVMLSGDGADELFWGYPRFKKSLDHFYWFKIHINIRRVLVPIYRKIFPKTSSAVDVFKNFNDWILYKQIHFNHINNLIPLVNFSKELTNTYSSKHLKNKKQALLFLKKNEFYAHLQMVLRKVDLMSMANSLEVRVPFLDKSCIEFSNTISPEYGIKHKKSKYILKELLSQFLNNNITNLSKKGFTIPIDKWLTEDLKEDVLETLKYDNFFGNEYINKQYFLKLIKDFSENNNKNYRGIWHLYAWQKWINKYKND